MMDVGQAEAYGISAVLYISGQQRRGPVSGTKIAEECHIPRAYLLKVLRRLVEAGVLTSHGGRSGGFTLARPPARITLQHIIAAVIADRTAPTGLTTAAVSNSARGLIERAFRDVARYEETAFKKVTLAELSKV